MPNLNTVLRAEIQRLARKEIRAQTATLKKHVTEQRRTIATLRRDVADLKRTQTFLQKREKRRLERAQEAPAAEEADNVRFSPKWVAADRNRLGLSAKDYGRLVGVSMLTIYNWEKGKSKPRAPQLAAWAKVRGIGKREAAKRLELLGG
jgi:DNA-binding transcriptional regulator YiaG